MTDEYQDKKMSPRRPRPTPWHCGGCGRYLGRYWLVGGEFEIRHKCGTVNRFKDGVLVDPPAPGAFDMPDETG